MCAGREFQTVGAATGNSGARAGVGPSISLITSVTLYQLHHHAAISTSTDEQT